MYTPSVQVSPVDWLGSWLCLAGTQPPKKTTTECLHHIITSVCVECVCECVCVGVWTSVTTRYKGTYYLHVYSPV